MLNRLLFAARQHAGLSALTLAATGMGLIWLSYQYNPKRQVRELFNRLGRKWQRLKGIRIIYSSSEAGNAKKVAVILEDDAKKRGVGVSVTSIEDYDSEGGLKADVKASYLVVIVLETPSAATPVDEGAWVYNCLLQEYNQSSFLEGLVFAVVGVASPLDKLCQVADNIDGAFAAIAGSRRLLPVSTVIQSEDSFQMWRSEFWGMAAPFFSESSYNPTSGCHCSKPTCCKGSSNEVFASGKTEEERPKVLDIEELAGMAEGASRRPLQGRTSGKSARKVLSQLS